MIEELKDIKVLMHNQYEAIGKKIGEEFFIPITLLEKGYDLEKEWLNTKNTLKIHVTKKRFLAIDHYDYQGNYLHYDRNRVENWNVEFHHGIPKTVYPYGKYFNPSTIAQYGLQHYSLYLKTRDLESKQKFLRVADWFVSHQDAHGGWPYQFDLHYYPNRLKEKIKAPWYSAIGLGMSMSVLVRATVLTKDRKYERCALKATPIFNIPSEKNGILAKFEGKYMFYEECPTDPPSFILNGFMFALIGLYDLYKLTGDIETKKLYQEGIISLKRMLPLYDLGYCTAYDLTQYTTDGGYPNVANWGYHITHIHLLAALNSIEKDTKMNKVLQRWKGYLEGKRFTI